MPMRRANSRLMIAALLVAVLHAPALATLEAVNLKLVRYAYFLDTRRSAASIEFAEAFKNGNAGMPPRLQASPIRLTGAEVARTSPELEILRARHPALFPPGETPPTVYEARVLHLRKGDVVDFDGRVAVALGRFLGAGNNSHIFEAADVSDAAIKIPFSSHRRTAAAKKILGDLAKKAGLIPPDVPRVRIIEASPSGDYAIVSKIHGRLNGRDFLERDFPSDADNPVLLSRKRRLLYLVARMYGVRDILKFGRKHEAAQFIWDEDEKDWVLADWE